MTTKSLNPQIPNNQGSALIIYSGGLDTTVCIPLLREEGYTDIHTVCIDVGQPGEDIAQAEERARILGTKHTTVDAKEEFANDYCSIAITFNADYFGYPLSTAIARPLIAKKAAEAGIAVGKEVVFVHGCTGKGNDQFRIEFGLRKHAPGMRIYAPIREHNWTRTAEIEYAEKVGAPIGQSKDKIWSIDENFWGRSIEGGRLEEPSYQPPEEIFAWTSSLADAPNEPQLITIDFQDGKPVGIDGIKVSILQAIMKANELAGKHGVGRIDIMEDRMIGMKVRENYECPGASLLIKAHKELEALVCAPQERRFKSLVDAQWAELTYQGLWGDPLFDDLVAFSNNIQKRVTGSVTLRLFKGHMQVVSRSSRFALYSEAVASFDDSAVFEQSEMTGMVRAHGISSLLYSKLMGENGG
ncbi:MAG TPA: argininosuccinate synthase [Fimbriimonadaceae bacterium]|nr:argininosuccinate synthase [Fimbriimonadaceae bacterium]